MNVANLIKNSPEVQTKLQALGLSDTNIATLGEEISGQLAAGEGFDLTGLLTSLNVDAFVRRVNVDQLAEKLLVSPQLAQRAVSQVGPLVDGFGAKQKGLLGRVVSSIFN